MSAAKIARQVVIDALPAPAGVLVTTATGPLGT
jgi:hypothetical protein